MAFDQSKPAINAPLASVDVRNNFQHLKTAINKEHAWDDANPANTTHSLDQIKGTVSGSTQRDTATGIDSVTGAGNVVNTYRHVNNGVTANTYSLQGLLQELVNRSHRHSVDQILTNCNCDCNCNCGDGE